MIYEESERERALNALFAKRREAGAETPATIQAGPLATTSILFLLTTVPGDVAPLLASAERLGMPQLPAAWMDPAAIGSRDEAPSLAGWLAHLVGRAVGPVVVPVPAQDYFMLLRLNFLAAFPQASFALVTRGTGLLAAGARFLDAHPQVDPDGPEAEAEAEAIARDAFASAQHEGVIRAALEVTGGRGQPAFLEAWRRSHEDFWARLAPEASLQPVEGEAVLEPPERAVRERQLNIRLREPVSLRAREWLVAPLEDAA